MTYDERRHKYLYRLDTLSHPSIYLVHGTKTSTMYPYHLVRVRVTRPQPTRLIPSTHLELRHPALRLGEHILTSLF